MRSGRWESHAKGDKGIVSYVVDSGQAGVEEAPGGKEENGGWLARAPSPIPASRSRQWSSFHFMNGKSVDSPERTGRERVNLDLVTANPQRV